MFSWAFTQAPLPAAGYPFLVLTFCRLDMDLAEALG